MDYVLLDVNKDREALLPLTFLRPISDIRLGILTIREKWEHFLNEVVKTYVEHDAGKQTYNVPSEDRLYINASFVPDESLLSVVLQMSKNKVVVYMGEVVCSHFLEPFNSTINPSLEIISLERATRIGTVTDIFTQNHEAIKRDFELLTSGKTSEPIPDGVGYINKKGIFIEKGASVTFSFLNASEGPIYIGRGATIMEGSTVRGPVALCENACLKMGARIYGATTIGPHCKIGGEVKNSVFFGYSNKGHEGYLGDSVIGEWCNLGANTNASNMKNNCSQVRIWSYANSNYLPTNLQFCGLIMGDHSKTAINTTFNTGSVVGIFAHVFGGLPTKYTPSFSWGVGEIRQAYPIEKATVDAQKFIALKQFSLSEDQKTIFKTAFELTQKYDRNFYEN